MIIHGRSRGSWRPGLRIGRYFLQDVGTFSPPLPLRSPPKPEASASRI